MKNGVILRLTAVAFFLSLCGGWEGSARAQTVKETTHVKKNGSTIVVRTMAPAEVVSVEPYIDAKKGKAAGRLLMDVVIKNTAKNPQSYRIFGQGKTETGGWLGGVAKAPEKGKLDAGQQVTAKVKTRYEGKSVPDEMRVDVFSPQ
ncbi:MAG: hypothetical protein ACREQ7_07600 [Candidatus Binatia bacterium]